MSLVINELSLVGFADKYAFFIAIDMLDSIINELNNKFGIRIQDIFGKDINPLMLVTEELNYSQLLKEIPDRECRSRMFSLLVNTREYCDAKNALFVEGVEAKGASYAYFDNGVMVSLSSRELFNRELVDCYDSDNNICSVRNIAENAHIYEHANYIIVRVYQPNEKHREKEYIRSFGEEVSEMDLDDETAQQVLNKAIVLNDRLYGVYNGEIYEFRKTLNYIYHGYKLKDEILDKHLKKRILECVNLTDNI
ncbi:hypothetical protein [Butyrivibrio sp. XPD2002]|uniref:hypothetical protein n=1 Tax=Butyrivibrio sp. XPD2002 TaxID=1280665 RepID=UPI0004095F29|nr:hypothetical protein [Butyrivibrio sp. XPD2002]